MLIIRLKTSLRKYYGFLTLLCVFLGFIFPQFSVLSIYIPVLLAILVFSMVVEHEISDFSMLIKHPKSLLSLISSNLILYPLIGFLLVYLFFSSNKNISTGVILLCFAPFPVIASLWTEMSGGDGTISLTTALFSMIISIGVYPVVLYFLGIASPNLSLEIFKLLVMSVFVPALIALFLRGEEKRLLPSKRKFKLIAALTGLFIIVIAIFNMSSKFFSNEFNTIFLISIFVIVLLITGLVYGHLLSRILKVKKDNNKAFLYTSCMRDGIIPLSVSTTYFSYLSSIPSTILLIIMPFIVSIVYQILKSNEKNL